MAGGNPGGKGNPASHRMGNKHLKESRVRRWAHGERRKEQRAAAQRARETVNRGLRKAGEPVPWQQARAARQARRVQAGARERWLAAQKTDQLPAA